MPTSSATRLALVLPKFDLEEAQRSPPATLERLLSYSRGLTKTLSPLQYEPWQSEVFQALAKSDGADLSSGSITWWGATGERDAATWLHADPVRLEVSTDGMALKLTRPWTARELEIAGNLFQEFLTRSQMSWRVAGGRSFIRSVSPLSVRTLSPHRVAVTSLRDSLPVGDDASMLRRLMTELQMLLHDKFNDPAAPNAVWLWGSGALPSSAASAEDLPYAWTDDAFTRGLYRWYSAEGRCMELPESFDAILRSEVGRCLAVVNEGRVNALEQNWIAPATEALRTGRLQSVEINLNGWHATAQRSRLRRWFTRSRPLSELLREAHG